MVEFAIILPVFALMLFGMIQFGLGFAGWDELRNAVQTSTPVAANNPTNSSPNCGQTDPGSNLVCRSRAINWRSGGHRAHPAEHFDDPAESVRDSRI